MNNKVRIGKNYANISKALEHKKVNNEHRVPSEPISKILRNNYRKESISNNDRFDQIRKEIAISYSK